MAPEHFERNNLLFHGLIFRFKLRGCRIQPLHLPRNVTSKGEELFLNIYLHSPSFVVMITLPETNVAAENRPSQKETIVFQPSIFRCECLLLVSGRVFCLFHLTTLKVIVQFLCIALTKFPSNLSLLFGSGVQHL